MTAQSASQVELADPQISPVSWAEWWIVALAGTCSGALVALVSGQDTNWDVRSTYYYTAYAWLHGRGAYDIAPGQIANWLNPLVYVPQYLLINRASPAVAGALLGAAAGIDFVLIYLLARSVVRGAAFSTAVAVAVFAAVGGVSTPQYLDSLGRVSGDPFVSALVLASLLVLMRGQALPSTRRPPRYTYSVCGLLMGAACGLKLTCMIFAIGLTAALVVSWRLLRLDWQRFESYAACGVAGFIVTGGYWAALLSVRYYSPVFPYWNRVFRSPWAAFADVVDARYLPYTLADALAYPFHWLGGGTFNGEFSFRDTRFAVLAVLLPAVLLYLVLAHFTQSVDRASESGRLVSRQHFWLLTLFFLFSYVVWAWTFSIQRYMMPLGLTAGLLLLVLLDPLISDRDIKAGIFVVLTLLTAAGTEYAWVERVPYQKNWFGVQFSPAVSQPNTLFLLLGDQPSSYVLPFLPRSDQFIRLSGNFLVPSSSGNPSQWSGDLLTGAGTMLGRAARDAVRNHQGPIRSLTMDRLTPGDELQLARFGLEISEPGCASFHSWVDQFRSCSLVPRTPRPFLAVDADRHTVAWMAFPAAGAHLYVERNHEGREFNANGADGYELLEWLTPGDQFTFQMVEWDGKSEGRVLGTARVDEKGQTTIEMAPPASAGPSDSSSAPRP